MNIGWIPMIAEAPATTGLVQFDATMIMQIINTVILFVSLRKFLFEPVSEFMKKREKEIADGYEQVKMMQINAEKLQKQYELKMSQIEDKGSKIIKEASAKADARAKQIIRDSEMEVAKMKENAQSDIEQEQLKAINELKDDIASMVVLATSQIIQSDVSVDGHRQLISQIIDEMGDAKWQN